MDPHPLVTFLSYSHANQKQRKKLREHLIPLEREGLIRPWDDRQLRVGQEVSASIQAQLEETEVFLLLLSPEFIASEYCHGVEMRHALERHAEGSALVLPIIITPCDWQNSPVGKLVVAPTDGKPISNWRPVDAGWTDATRLVREAIVAFRMRRFGPEAPVSRVRSRSTWGAAVIALLAGVLALALFRPLPQKLSVAAPDAAVVVAARLELDGGSTKDAGSSRPSQVEFTVRSVPLAKIEVFVDDRLVNSGQSPLTTRLSPGRVQLKVSGCPEPCSKSESVDVAAFPRQQSHTATVARGTVLVRSRPAAHVTVDDGLYHDDTTCQFQLYEGEHRIHFECDRSTGMCADIQDVTQTVTAQPGRTTTITPQWE
jgi:TIR domain-containing protein